MPRRKSGSMGSWLEQLSQKITIWTGTSWAFGTAVAIIVLWAALGPVFDYSDTWQLVINTGTTIVTFLMVFLIQRTQNKDAEAMHLKLDELIAATKGASNRLLDVEDLTEKEIQVIRAHVQRLARETREEGDLGKSHSIEETEKLLARGKPPASRQKRGSGSS
jgi:low affinity Fe/Cu permease